MPIATILHKRVQMGVRDAARGLFCFDPMPIATILHKRVQMGVRDAARGLVHRNHSHKRAELERAMQPADGDLHPHLLCARRKWKVMTSSVLLSTSFLTGNFLSRRGIHTNKRASSRVLPHLSLRGGRGESRGAHADAGAANHAHLFTQICIGCRQSSR